MNSEKEKMLQGMLYDPFDSELAQDRKQARDLCQALNASREDEQESRRQILMKLSWLSAV